MDTTCEWRSRVPSLQPQIFGPKPRKPNLQHLPRTSPLPNPGLDLLRRQQEPLEPIQKATRTTLKPASNFTYYSGPQIDSGTVSNTSLVGICYGYDLLFFLLVGLSTSWNAQLHRKGGCFRSTHDSRLRSDSSGTACTEARLGQLKQLVLFFAPSLSTGFVYPCLITRVRLCVPKRPILHVI